MALIGNKLSLVLANLYIWFHAFLSLKIHDANVPRWILFLIRISLAFVVFSLAAASEFIRFLKPKNYIFLQ